MDFGTSCRSTSPSALTVLTASSVQTDDSVFTTITHESTDTPPVIDPKFCVIFSEILKRWQKGSMTKDDYTHLKTISISSQDYILISEEFNLRHGLEFVDNHLELYEYPTVVHESMNRIKDDWVHATYGRDIIKLGSMSDVILNMR
jgi:hypothetical protein